jgi:hypothetical protein
MISFSTDLCRPQFFADESEEGVREEFTNAINKGQSPRKKDGSLSFCPSFEK